MFFFFFFEDDVSSLIESSLTGEETVEHGEKTASSGYDLLLPRGCEKLRFPPRTAVQTYRRLAPGLLSRAIHNATDLLEKKVICQYAVVYEESNSAVFKVPHDLQERFVLLTVVELKHRAGYPTLIYKDWRKERDERLEKLKMELQFAPNTLFVGAGLSCSLGVPNWDDLMGKLARGVRLGQGSFEDISKDSMNNNLLMARYLKNVAKSQKKRMVTCLRPILYKRGLSSSSLMDSIVDLIQQRQIDEVITYNYDNYLESTLGSKDIPFISVDRQSRRIKNNIPILHVHGLIHPTDKTFDQNVVLSEDEYHELYRDSYHWANVAQLYALTHTTCVFVGLSMRDPSLRRLLDIANKHGSGGIEHYAFLRRDEYKNHKEAEAIFSQMGVGIIWCENKADVAVQVGALVK